MNLFDGLDQYIAQARPRFEEWLGRLVEIPTVSMDPARRNDMRRGAEVAVGCLTALGAQATIVETGGHPLVVGGWMRDPAWPTVAVYNHLDVQPAMEPEWTREPFKFTVEGESYYGRGDRKSTRLNSSHGYISYAVFCLKKKKKNQQKYNHNEHRTNSNKMKSHRRHLAINDD